MKCIYLELINSSCTNTEMEEDYGKEKKAKITVSTQLKGIPMYGANWDGDYKQLLLYQSQRLHHKKANIFYNDDCWKPFTMLCGFNGA